MKSGLLKGLTSLAYSLLFEPSLLWWTYKSSVLKINCLLGVRLHARSIKHDRIQLHERKMPTAILLHQHWELHIMKFVIFYPSHICSEECCTWPVKNTIIPGKKKKRHLYAFDFLKLLCHNNGGGTHFTQVGAKLNRQMEAAAVPEQESNLETGCWVPLDRARLSGEFTVRPFHFGSLSDWAVTKAKGSRFSSCDCFLCVFFPPHLNLNCPPGNLSAIKEKKGHWIIVM